MFMWIHKFSRNDLWHIVEPEDGKTKCGLWGKDAIGHKMLGCGGEEDPPIETVCKVCFDFLQK